MSIIVINRAYDPLQHSNRLFNNTAIGAEYLKLKNKFYEISRKIILDRKEVHLKNPEILKDTKNLTFLDSLLTVK